MLGWWQLFNLLEFQQELHQKYKYMMVDITHLTFLLYNHELFGWQCYHYMTIKAIKELILLYSQITYMSWNMSNSITPSTKIVVMTEKHNHVQNLKTVPCLLGYKQRLTTIYLETSFPSDFKI